MIIITFLIKDSTLFQQKIASLISLLLTTVIFIVFLRAYLLTGFLPYWYLQYHSKIFIITITINIIIIYYYHYLK